MKMWSSLATIVLLLSCLKCSGQLYPQLHAYESCTLPDGLQTVEVTGLESGVRSRSIKTSRGQELLALEAGRRIMFAYPGTDFYANVKAELLPAERWEAQRKLVLDGFDTLLASSNESQRNYALKPVLNGFHVQGLDREKLEGGVLGIYILIDDTERIVTTIYFLNQEPEHRKFATLQEYASLRDAFLAGYTRCIRHNQGTPAN